jgi:hypothetical protein
MGLALNVSHDGGRTFTSLDTPGGDHHGLWIDPQNANYLVNVFDQGFAISYDRGKTWKDSSLTLPVCQFFNVAYDMDTPFHVFGSMQDHGSFRGVVDLAPRTRSTRRTRTSSSPRASTGRSPARISRSRAPGRARTCCRRRIRARPRCAGNGWRPRSSPLTASASSTTACST